MFLFWQKRWSGAMFLAGEACDRLNATHRSEGKDYYMGCIWFSWPAQSGFRITQHSSEWKDGISLLRRTSYQSGAPWCTEPPLGSLPRATALYSMPVTSRRGNTTPRTYQWLPTQVSKTIYWGFVTEVCSNWSVFLYHQQLSVSILAVVSNAPLKPLRYKVCAFISMNNRLWPACVV